MFLLRVLVVLCAPLSSAVSVLKWPPLRCPRQDMNCTVTTSNCMDKSWLNVAVYTPSSPDELQVSVDTRQDERGRLQPVLVASWKIKDDGSIRYLKATELHVLMMSTNQNLCVRYSLKDPLLMRSPSGEKWSFSTNMVVLDPGQHYKVSVFNIPKPELDHSSYDVSATVVVPNCHDSKMQMTQFCIDRGSLWKPNISLAESSTVGGSSALAVSFNPDELCQEYWVIVQCPSFEQYVDRVYKGNHTTMTVTISLDKWPRSCCKFNVQIKPLFLQCGHDCERRSATLDVCRVTPPDSPDDLSYIFVIVVVLMSAVMAVVMVVLCRNKGKVGMTEDNVGGENQRQIIKTPKVLVIYSHDHYLYRDVVLKLCAFLQIKCGTNVVVDLLDSTSVGMVGRVRWLEWQRQQLKNPSDKILVLCSKGVQAKWRALCGQGRVTLKEDVLSPTDDMVTPFLHLFLPDMHQAGMLGKYMVAYFDDISSEQDIPSVFDIAVKYKLMKHFEELYFRIADVEKYQPGLVNHIKGIGGEEYFNCNSGSDLKNAIEIFQAYQLENPDWFEKECVHSEEEVMTEANLLIHDLQIPPILEFVPAIRDGPPVHINEVEVTENCNSVHVITPELNPQNELSSAVELTPIVNHERRHQYPSNLDHILTDNLYHHSLTSEPIYRVEPVLNKPPTPAENFFSLQEEPPYKIPTEDDEEDLLMPKSPLSSHLDLRRLVLQHSLDSQSTEYSCVNMHSEYNPISEVSHSLPEEMENIEVLESTGNKGPNSGSDQGYISKISSQHEAPFKEDPMIALARLQEELFKQNLRS
ncbi:interleukin 17 receptor A1a isoform X1 [Echeneis naucrates]|uniref:Interleukin-17 receptor A-like n=2 Tax=Echeneis naucrates TaxID=173247 RepID=A0A665WAB4_ECHNA|nr:interleukin-17 receptor A-like isoform X1 [Echeneis naucrates]